MKTVRVDNNARGYFVRHDDRLLDNEKWDLYEIVNLYGGDNDVLYTQDDAWDMDDNHQLYEAISELKEGEILLNENGNLRVYTQQDLENLDTFLLGDYRFELIVLETTEDWLAELNTLPEKNAKQLLSDYDGDEEIDLAYNGKYWEWIVVEEENDEE